MYKILTKSEIEKLDLPAEDLRIALMFFSMGAEVRLAGETDSGYTLTYSLPCQTVH